MANSFFKFKRFTVNQDITAMKVGTDGVLLGAWCRIEDGQSRILDVGTGTGLLALMAAQRSRDFDTPSLIDALEIDRQSCMQAVENFQNSPWSSRLSAVNCSLQTFCTDRTYDHIISNPPFFNNSLTCPDGSRTAARHTTELSYSDLACGVDRLLSSTGIVSLIVPVDESQLLVSDFELHNFSLSRLTRVYPNIHKPPKRVLLEFVREAAEIITECADLTIETDTRHHYTDEYRLLTEDFYL